MELPSKKITEDIQKKFQSLRPIIVKDINQIEAINENMNNSSLAPKIGSYVDKKGNICHSKKTFDGHRDNISTHQLNFPYRIDFNCTEGSFVDENIFCPRIYLASQIGDETDFQTDILETKFISVISEMIETPKIVLSEPFKRINLSEFFSETDHIFICFKSEIPIISRLLVS